MDAIALGCLTAIASSRTMFSRGVIGMLAGVGAALMVGILAFSNQVQVWGLGRSGLDMTMLALGSCMVIAAAAQSRWKSPRVLFPLLALGRCSYEVYLSHMFIVFALFGLYQSSGHPRGAVPVFFLGVVLLSGLSGVGIARFYSEPMNRLIRRRLGDE